jgi:chemotaxis protein CheZ
MATTKKLGDTADSDELQALFDSIAGKRAVARVEVVASSSGSGDNDELQALFDEAAVDYATAAAPARVADGEPGAGASGAGDGTRVFNRVGQMARQLHDMMRELGVGQILEDTARAIPDARQRLNYIAQMTESAASRALNATDIAKPIQQEIESQARALGERWEKLMRKELGVADFKALALDTRGFLVQVPERTAATNAQLTEIMMAQDFQDLTGQVIKRLVTMAQRMEDELLELLVDVVPEERRAVAEGLLNGPVTLAAGRTDVVAGQKQVDDLLESLGF